MTISGVVMAHKKRKAWALELSENLGLPIVWDKINDRHETGLRCLEAGLGSNATHHVVIQDDAIVCRDLLAGLDEAVKVSRDRLVGLYVGNLTPHADRADKQVKAARESGRSWLAMPGPYWGVGIVIPTVHLESLVEFFRKSQEKNYDRRIERWAAQAKVECWYTMPSLVDHRSGVENPSLVPNRTSLTRNARWFIGEDASALDVDWSLTPPPLTGVWRNTRSNRIIRTRPGSIQSDRLQASGLWEPVRQIPCGECGSARYVSLTEAVSA